MKVPRWITGIIIAVGLTFIVISLLGFAHAFSNSTRCFETFAGTQWPKWIGCAMAAHENLAGGLIGLAGAIFAAWLAYSGAQDQLAHVRKLPNRQTGLLLKSAFKKQQARSPRSDLRKTT